MLASQVVSNRDGRGGDEFVSVAIAASSQSDDTIGSVDSEQLVPFAQAAPSGQVRPLLWYQVAGTDHGVSPYLLEALHQVETSAAPDGCWSNVEGSGAIGPFQFKQATFAIYGVDANDDGVVDICSFADSLASAANYLRALGADGGEDSDATRRALERYGTDPARVIDLALYYRSRENGGFDISSIELRQNVAP
jgi:hypothetical protein